MKSQPVMLFMKGSPQSPRCGFSSRVVKILKQHGMQFGHFDILSDQAIRQAAKVRYLTMQRVIELDRKEEGILISAKFAWPS